MYGIFAYISHKFMVNVGKYSIHGASGFGNLALLRCLGVVLSPCDVRTGP